jgi:hypothetical protein
MTTHRTTRARLSKRPTHDNRRAALPEPEPDDGLAGLMYALRDDLRRADAFITTAERQIEENWHDDDEDDLEEEDRKMRHRMRVEYLVEAGKYAVRGALYAAQQIDAEITRRRSA